VGHVLPGLAHARRAPRSPSGARRGRALQPRRRRVEGGRLVPLGRVPARLRLRLHLRDGDAQGRLHGLPLRDARPVPLASRPGRRLEPRGAPRRPPRDVEAPDRVAELRALLEGLRGRSLVRRAEAVGADAARPRLLGPEDIYGAPAVYAPRGPRPPTTGTSSRPGPGTTASTSPTAAGSARFSSTRTPRSGSARTCSRRSSGSS
jgi:hypothetical protein